MVDKHCRNGCSIKRAPLSVSYYNEISGGHIERAVVWRRCSAGPVLPLWLYTTSLEQDSSVYDSEMRCDCATDTSDSPGVYSLSLVYVTGVSTVTQSLKSSLA